VNVVRRRGVVTGSRWSFSSSKLAAFMPQAVLNASMVGVLALMIRQVSSLHAYLLLEEGITRGRFSAALVGEEVDDHERSFAWAAIDLEKFSSIF